MPGRISIPAREITAARGKFFLREFNRAAAALCIGTRDLLIAICAYAYRAIGCFFLVFRALVMCTLGWIKLCYGRCVCSLGSLSAVNVRDLVENVED